MDREERNPERLLPEAAQAVQCRDLAAWCTNPSDSHLWVTVARDQPGLPWGLSVVPSDGESFLPSPDGSLRSELGGPRATSPNPGWFSREGASL